MLEFCKVAIQHVISTDVRLYHMLYCLYIPSVVNMIGSDSSYLVVIGRKVSSTGSTGLLSIRRSFSLWAPS